VSLLPGPVVDTLLPTTMVGSFPRPKWYRNQLHGQSILHAFKLEEYRQAYQDATLAVIEDQQSAGLDVVTDGQMYYDDYTGSIGSLLWYWYERIPGFSNVLPSSPLNVGERASWAERETHAVMGGTTVTAKVSPPVGDSGLVEMYRIAQQRTRTPLKYGVGALPGNLTFHVDLSVPGSAYRTPQALAEDLVPIFNDELKALVRAGCEFIQIDDLSPWLLLQGSHNRWIIDVLNGVIDGVDAKIAWHCCMGATYGNAASDLAGQLETVVEAMYEVNVDQYVLDFAHGDMEEVGVLQSLPGDKEVAVGVIDVRTLQIETEAQVADRMRKALDVVPAERLWFTTDCGMKALHRFTAQGKLHALVDAARTVRAEVTGRTKSLPLA
jgi:5-methyltetrahydropteroyltriglutamate--homocysteine methyltransferase